MGPLLLEFCFLPFGSGLPSCSDLCVCSDLLSDASFLFAKTILPTYCLQRKVVLILSFILLALLVGVLRINFCQLMAVLAFILSTWEAKAGGISELEAASLVYRDGSVENCLLCKCEDPEEKKNL